MSANLWFIVDVWDLLHFGIHAICCYSLLVVRVLYSALNSSSSRKHCITKDAHLHLFYAYSTSVFNYNSPRVDMGGLESRLVEIEMDGLAVSIQHFLMLLQIVCHIYHEVA